VETVSNFARFRKGTVERHLDEDHPVNAGWLAVFEQFLWREGGRFHVLLLPASRERVVRRVRRPDVNVCVDETHSGSAVSRMPCCDFRQARVIVARHGAERKHETIRAPTAFLRMEATGNTEKYCPILYS